MNETKIENLRKKFNVQKRLSTGLFDKDGNEIFEGDTIIVDDCCEESEKFLVRYGLGTYDSGHYKYIGFFLEKLNMIYAHNKYGWTDGNANLMFETNRIRKV